MEFEDENIEDIKNGDLWDFIACGVSSCYVKPHKEIYPNNIPAGYVLCLTVNEHKLEWARHILDTTVFEVEEDTIDRFDFDDPDYGWEALREIKEEYDYAFYLEELETISEAQWEVDAQKVADRFSSEVKFFSFIEDNLMDGSDIKNDEKWMETKQYLKEKGASLFVEAMEATEHTLEKLPSSEIYSDMVEVFGEQFLRSKKSGKLYLMDFVIPPVDEDWDTYY